MMPDFVLRSIRSAAAESWKLCSRASDLHRASVVHLRREVGAIRRDLHGDRCVRTDRWVREAWSRSCCIHRDCNSAGGCPCHEFPCGHLRFSRKTFRVTPTFFLEIFLEICQISTQTHSKFPRTAHAGCIFFHMWGHIKNYQYLYRCLTQQT